MEMQIGPVIADVAGQTLTQDDIELLKHPSLGGIILFARNYDNPEQVMDLIKHIRMIRPRCFITVDQEGGRVQRFVTGLTKLPPMQSLGRLFDEQQLNAESVLKVVKQIGQLMAMELRSLGVDLSFAPVLDLATDLNPVVKTRAIHSDPAIVNLLASHYVDGMLLAGMQACGKHFPGHGKVTADSHLSLPVDLRDFSEITDDLLPFAHLIKHGIASIMTGHLIFPKIEKLPATFSPYWLQTILRDKLKFNGAIICDDLNMDATKELGDPVMCAKLALSAGSDYILICNNRPQAEKILSSITASFDPKVVERRERLLSDPKTMIPWEKLHQHTEWKEARNALEQIGSWDTLQ
ncbi:beta-N-acetylhexosaminidase [Candidatus Berkiella cookevillensis]|uniref:beta-N-acetylhexosaminidase n=1 Tax=Candidatus Berkiella cookevillensis TaxID=437022 RepID=A0A0Q9YAE2_9GAMM|nr:beta-N-acetylhexosaminidase [Candidatus Berkiella cookevillensis]MCS5708032.1 beta-N-acetylhexosaminidase [Candidatus Berkiella cookevillensis]